MQVGPKVISLVLALSVPCAVIASDHRPDLRFGDAGIRILSAGDILDRDGNVLLDETWVLVPNTARVADDGTIYIGGSLNHYVFGRPDPKRHGAVMKVLPDGQVDPAFGGDRRPGVLELPEIVVGAQEQQVEALAFLQDGSIVAAGSASVGAPETGFIVKIRPDGSFGLFNGDASNRQVAGARFHAIEIDRNDNIVVAGERVDGRAVPYIRGLVTWFSSAGDVLSSTELVRDGIDELTYIRSMHLLPDGGVILGGGHQHPRRGPSGEFIDNYDLSIARLDARGALDPGFAGTGWQVFEVPDAAFDVEEVQEMTVDDDGGIVFVAYAGTSGGVVSAVLGRLDVDGVPDAGFGDAATPGFARPLQGDRATQTLPVGLGRLPDGSRVVAASFAGDEVFDQNLMAARFDANGVLDPGFGNDGVLSIGLDYGGFPTDETRALAIDGDDIVLVGATQRIHPLSDPEATLVGAATDTAVVRLTRKIFDDSFER